MHKIKILKNGFSWSSPKAKSGKYFYLRYYADSKVFCVDVRWKAPKGHWDQEKSSWILDPPAWQSQTLVGITIKNLVSAKALAEHFVPEFLTLVKYNCVPLEKDFRRPFCQAISTYCTTNKLTEEEL